MDFPETFGLPAVGNRGRGMTLVEFPQGNFKFLKISKSTVAQEEKENVKTYSKPESG